MIVGLGPKRKPNNPNILNIFKPFSNHFQTIFKPFSNHFQTIFKPFSNHFQTIFKPFSNNPTFWTFSKRSDRALIRHQNRKQTFCANTPFYLVIRNVFWIFLTHTVPSAKRSRSFSQNIGVLLESTKSDGKPNKAFFVSTIFKYIFAICDFCPLSKNCRTNHESLIQLKVTHIHGYVY
jgi:hypothetical protein